MAGYWRDVHSRTIAAARKAANIETRDKMIMVIVVQMIIGAVIFYLTQQSDMTTRVVSALAPFLLLPVWYILKLPSVPPEMAQDAERRHTQRVAEIEVQRDAALAELHALRKPPPPERDPDGLYQFERKVGQVRVPRQDLARGLVSFEQIVGAIDLNVEQQFEYRDFILRIESRSSEGRVSFGGQRERSIEGVHCRIIGRR